MIKKYPWLITMGKTGFSNPLLGLDAVALVESLNSSS